MHDIYTSSICVVAPLHHPIINPLLKIQFIRNSNGKRPLRFHAEMAFYHYEDVPFCAFYYGRFPVALNFYHFMTSKWTLGEYQVLRWSLNFSLRRRLEGIVVVSFWTVMKMGISLSYQKRKKKRNENFYVLNQMEQN